MLPPVFASHADCGNALRSSFEAEAESRHWLRTCIACRPHRAEFPHLATLRGVRSYGLPYALLGIPSIKKGSTAYPNIASTLEESPASKPLTPESYSRFRRALGNILWLAQTRQDIKFAVGLMSTQQAAPTQATESGLRALLRFLFEDRDLVLQLPSPELDAQFLGQDHKRLGVWGPLGLRA